MLLSQGVWNHRRPFNGTHFVATWASSSVVADQQDFPLCLRKFVKLMQVQLVDLWERTCYPLIEKHKNYRTESCSFYLCNSQSIYDKIWSMELYDALALFYIGCQLLTGTEVSR